MFKRPEISQQNCFFLQALTKQGGIFDGLIQANKAFMLRNPFYCYIERFPYAYIYIYIFTWAVSGLESDSMAHQ